MNKVDFSQIKKEFESRNPNLELIDERYIKTKMKTRRELLVKK